MIWASRRIAALLLAAGVAGAGCTQVTYVDRGNAGAVDVGKEDEDLFSRRVDYHIDRAFYETPPDCAMVLPVKLPEGAARELGDQIDDAVARHLSGRLDRVIGARRLRAEARKRAFDPDHPDDRRRFGQALRCDSYLEVETAGVDSFYAVVWANLSIGIRLSLKRARDGQVLWRGAHRAERGDGSLPISFLGVSAGALTAGRLAGDRDAVPSMIDDSLRRTLASLPDMRRN